MLRLALASSLVASLAGCSLYFETNQQAAPDAACYEQPPGTGGIPALTLVNPDTLVCQTFDAGGGGTCNCGPCPENPTNGVAIPTWGACYSDCNQLGESACLATDGCRVARDWESYYTSQPSFIGCYADDTAPQTTTQSEPCEVRGAEDCSDDSACAGLYVVYLTTQAGNGNGSSYAFQECIPAAQVAGSCYGKVACDIAVSCPAGTTPGTDGICYTGSCIPDALCIGSGSAL